MKHWLESTAVAFSSSRWYYSHGQCISTRVVWPLIIAQVISAAHAPVGEGQPRFPAPQRISSRADEWFAELQQTDSQNWAKYELGKSLTIIFAELRFNKIFN